MTSIQRYYRFKNEYDHYERRYKMLSSITLHKQDELENLMNHINQLLLLENKTISSIKLDPQCVYDHGDHSSILSLKKFSFDHDEESDDDPLLQRLKLIKPSRLKTSSRQILNNNNNNNNNNTKIDFTSTNILDEIHRVYDEYFSE